MLIFSCFNAQLHTCGHALVHTVLIVSETLTMVASGNKIKSRPRFFEIL